MIDKPVIFWQGYDEPSLYDPESKEAMEALRDGFISTVKSYSGLLGDYDIDSDFDFLCKNFSFENAHKFWGEYLTELESFQKFQITYMFTSPY